MNDTLKIVAPCLIVFVLTVLAAFVVYKMLEKKKIADGTSKVKLAEREAESIVENAKKQANETIKAAEAERKEKVILAKEEIQKEKAELDKEIKERRAESQKQEKRILQKEETLEKKIENLEKKELQLLADKNDVSIAWIVRRAIKEYLEKNK